MNGLTKANAMRVAIHAQSDVGILQQALLTLVDEMEDRDNGNLSVYSADGVENKIWSVLQQTPEQRDAVKMVRRFMVEHPGVLEAAARIAEAIAPSGWEYEVTTGPRKSWDYADVPPEDKDGKGPWEKDPTQGRDGWERFDYHEEAYWRRWVGPGLKPGTTTGVPGFSHDGGLRP